MSDIGLSDEKFAWDINWHNKAEEPNRDVFAVAPGKVVRYEGDLCEGDRAGAVLIEHSSRLNRWWSGYLHLSNIQVTEGQKVGFNTKLGKVGRQICDGSSVPVHLHLAIYEGENTQGTYDDEGNQTGGLHSIDAVFFKRK